LLNVRSKVELPEHCKFISRKLADSLRVGFAKDASKGETKSPQRGLGALGDAERTEARA